MPAYVDVKQTFLRQFYRRLYWFKNLPMNQRILVILFPAIFFLLIIMYFRSSSSSTSSSSKVVSDQPVRVDFFVMSRCPDARKCELLFAPALLKLAPIINFTVSYIAYGSSPSDIQCMHGEEECQGNRQQLCVQNQCSQTTFIKFLQCQSKQIDEIPSNGEKCVQEASDGTLKWSDIQTCLKSGQANQLLYQSIQRTRAASAKKSCTIHLNGKFWCMHDGSWYDCSEGQSEVSLIKAICSRYTGKDKPAECAAAA